MTDKLTQAEARELFEQMNSILTRLFKAGLCTEAQRVGVLKVLRRVNRLIINLK